MAQFFADTGINFVQAILSSQMLLVLIPVLSVFRNNTDVTRTYRLYPVPAGAVVWVVLAGICIYPAVNIINAISQVFIPTPVDSDILYNMSSYPFPVTLFIVAILPAVCEEVVFRGFIFGGYRNNGFLRATIVSSLLFSLFHLDFSKIAFTFVVGIFLCFIVEATGSLISSMICHGILNGISVMIKYAALEASTYEDIEAVSASDIVSGLNESMIYTIAAILVVIAIVFLALTVMFVRLAATGADRAGVFSKVFGKDDVPRPYVRIGSGTLVLVFAIAIAYMVLYSMTIA